ncbi:hypothetical protein SLS53_007919 [Cytospora paraplurivora]|uniref:Uncharacterized protein n=1 Tax=Cytospora paraplurivora TaxID=2898453 RepID=A0AAN9U083_9PEZI
MSSSQDRNPRKQKQQQTYEESESEESGSEEQYQPPQRSNRRNRQQNQVQRRQQQGGGALDQAGLGGVGQTAQGLQGGVTNTLGGVANNAVNQQQQGGGGGGGGKSDTLRLRLDLNLDIEITLKAKIHGDLELALLYVLILTYPPPFSPNDSHSSGKPVLVDARCAGPPSSVFSSQLHRGPYALHHCPVQNDKDPTPHTTVSHLCSRF